MMTRSRIVIGLVGLAMVIGSASAAWAHPNSACRPDDVDCCVEHEPGGNDWLNQLNCKLCVQNGGTWFYENNDCLEPPESN